MDGHDEWRYFTDKDIEEQHKWEDTCDAWDAAFIKSRKKNVWMFHAKGTGQYACEVKLFDSKEAAVEYMEQLKKSEIGRLYSIDPWNCIEKLPIYKCHKEVKEI